MLRPDATSPVCSTESVAFSEIMPKFQERGCVILGCTVAKPQDIITLKKTPLEEGGVKGIKFPIICDEEGVICLSYGMLEDNGVARRGLVILGRGHEIKHVSIYDRQVGRCANVTLSWLNAYQETDRLSMGMPIEWPDKAHRSNIHMTDRDEETAKE
jgi:peroxiredoxin (alkyl hydroperoxide reductase subunit C)